MPDPNCHVNISKPDDPGDVAAGPMMPPGTGMIFCRGNATYGTNLRPYQIKGIVLPWEDNSTPPTVPANPPDSGWIFGEIDWATSDFQFGTSEPFGWLLGPANHSSTGPYPKNTVKVWAYFPPDTVMGADRICSSTFEFGGKTLLAAPAPSGGAAPASLGGAAPVPCMPYSSSSSAGFAAPMVMAEQSCDRWIHFRNLPTDSVGPGTKLLLADGTPLKASKILVYAYDIHWRYGAAPNTMVHRALGNYRTATSGWKFVGCPEYSINVYQTDPFRRPEPVASEAETHPHAMNLNPLLPVHLQVNNLESFSAYSGHRGTFSIAIRVIA